jgi:hypothetical protein
MGSGGNALISAFEPKERVHVLVRCGRGRASATGLTLTTYNLTTGQPVLPSTAAQTLGRVVANA